MTREESYMRVQKRDSKICLAFSAACIILVLLALPIVSKGEATTQAAGESCYVAVHEGDTLWSISLTLCGDGTSTTQCIQWIVEHNNLTGYVISPGQILEVPGTC